MLNLNIYHFIYIMKGDNTMNNELKEVISSIVEIDDTEDFGVAHSSAVTNFDNLEIIKKNLAE